MKYKVYIPQPIAQEAENYLEKNGCIIVRGNGKTDEESMKSDITDCNAMILRTAKVTEKALAAGSNLKIVARHGAGYDNLDWKAAEKMGIYATYSPDTTSLSVAEFTIAAILALSKKLKTFENKLRENDFGYKFTHKGMDVAGKTLGIAGFGRIGRLVAKKAALGLDMKVITYVPRPKGKEFPEYVQLTDWDTLFKKSDFISVHVPGGANNHGLIGQKEFKLMKPSAFLVNVSRGGVVDEAAFVEAVNNEEIAGGAIDVFEKEPPEITDPILKLNNVMLTPHIGSNTTECMTRIAMDVAEDVLLVLSGGKPRHPINI